MVASPLNQLALGPRLSTGQAPEPDDGEDDGSPMGGLQQFQDANTEPPSGGGETDEYSPAIDPEGITKLAKSLHLSATSMVARNAYRAQLQSMIDRPRHEPGQLNIPLLQMAANLLKPTHSGTLGEAVGQAAPVALQSLQEQRKLDEEGDDKQDALKLKLYGEQAADERTDEQTRLKMLLARYTKNPIQVQLKDGVYLVNPDGSKRKIGDLPGSKSMATVAIGAGDPSGKQPGNYRVDPSGGMTYLGPLSPQQNSPLNQYETKGDQLAAERDNEFYKGILEKGQNAQSSDRAIDTLTTLLKATKLQGAAAPAINRLLSMGQTLGIDPNDFNLPSASPGEVGRALTGRLILDKTGGKLGAGISNADVEFLHATMPNIGNTDAANDTLSLILKRMNAFDEDVMKFAYKYQNERKGSIQGLQQAINEEFGNKKILDDDGEFSRDNIQKLVAGEKSPTLKDTWTQGSGVSAAGIEWDYRNHKITKEERDAKLKKLGY